MHSEDPKKSFLALTSVFKLKEDKIEPTEMYLGAQLNKMYIDGNECWTMSAEKYVNASIKNVEETLAKQRLRLPSKCYTPLSSDYRPELDVSLEPKRDGI